MNFHHDQLTRAWQLFVQSIYAAHSPSAQVSIFTFQNPVSYSCFTSFCLYILLLVFLFFVCLSHNFWCASMFCPPIVYVPSICCLRSVHVQVTFLFPLHSVLVPSKVRLSSVYSSVRSGYVPLDTYDPLPKSSFWQLKTMIRTQSCLHIGVSLITTTMLMVPPMFRHTHCCPVINDTPCSNHHKSTIIRTQFCLHDSVLPIHTSSIASVVEVGDIHVNNKTRPIFMMNKGRN